MALCPDTSNTVLACPSINKVLPHYHHPHTTCANPASCRAVTTSLFREPHIRHPLGTYSPWLRFEALDHAHHGLGWVQGTVRVELYDSRKNTLIPAHESDLAQIALNLDGTR